MLKRSISQPTSNLQQGSARILDQHRFQRLQTQIAIVIIDNLGSHKGKTVRRAIRAAGAKLFFLPPYSPDLNPIEQAFAKLKTLLRKAAERTVEATWKRIGVLLNCFTPQECANYLANAGYASA